MKIKITDTTGASGTYTLPITIGEVAVDPTPVPVYSIRVSPTAIVAGNSVSVICAFENVGGAWLQIPGKPDQPLSGPAQTVIDRPTVTTEYALKVKIGTGYQYARASVTVSQPPNPPPITRKAKLGTNVVIHREGMQAAIQYDSDPITVTFNPEMAREIKQARPSVSVMCRPNIYKGALPDFTYWQQHVDQSFCPGMVVSSLNESDQIGTSPDLIRQRIEWDRRCLAWIKSESIRLGYTMYYAGGSFSVGEPNITDPEVVKAMAGYGELMRDPQFRFNQHSYSANDGAPDNSMTDIRDRVFKTDFIDAMSPCWRNGAIVQKPERIYRTDWTVTRFRFYYRRCGWDPLAPGRIVVDETGLEVGSYGSFPAVVGCDDAYMQKWARRSVELFSEPIEVDGIKYPSPVEWVAIFQAGPSTDWKSYDIRSRMPALQACGWGQR